MKFDLAQINPRRITAICILLFIIPFVLQWGGSRNAILQFFSHFEEHFAYDLKFKRNGIQKPGSQVAIIGIGEKSLEKLGRFPFSRTVYADLLQKLKALGVKTVAFDMLFAESEVGDADSKFINAIKDSEPLVLGYVYQDLYINSMPQVSIVNTVDPNDKMQKYLNPIPVVEHLNGPFLGELLNGIQPIYPITSILENTDRVKLGYFNSITDSDGALRRVPLIAYENHHIYPALALRAVEQYLNEIIKVDFSDKGFDELQLQRSGIKIPIRNSGDLYVKYYGPAGLIPEYEFSDVLAGNIDAKQLTGKLVFIGATALGLQDSRPTPVGENFPGVEIHATVASNIINQDFIVYSVYYHLVGFALLTFGAALFAFLVYKLNPVAATLTTMGLVFVFNCIDQYLIFPQGIIIPTFIPTLQYFLILFMMVLYKYLSTEHERRFVRQAFSRYVSESVVSEILKHQEKLKLGGEKQELTVLFSDIYGFTQIAERMDPALLSKLLNQFLSEMTEIVLANQGTLDKYMGDAMMCFWGAPLANAEHASFACKTALEMRQRLKDVRTKFIQKFGFALDLRIGINSGEMIVGNMGSEQIFNYTVLGDSVNMASRFESMNREYQSGIIVGENTVQLAKKNFCFRFLDFVSVRGKRDIVKVYELLCPIQKAAVYQSLIHSFNQAHEMYLARDFVGAKVAFQECDSFLGEDPVAHIFLQRIAALEQDPALLGKDGVWHGVQMGKLLTKQI